MTLTGSNHDETHGPTRRRFLGLSAACLTGACSLGAEAFAGEEERPSLRGAALTSLGKAYYFLGSMMDLYSKGTALRLSQSYVPTQALDLGDEGFTYDNAVMLIAFLQRGQAGDLTRANVLGNSLVYGQNHDPAGDGRVRNSYHTDPYILSGGALNIDDEGSYTGNLAWTGLALGQLYQRTKTRSYLNAAVRIGNWIQNNTSDTRGAGGYTGGLDSSLSTIPWKSTEHNIDVYALFTMLASLTANSAWTTRAQYALGFIEAMWDSGEFFWTGTGTDGITINTDFIPEDCQSWSYLALKNAAYASSIDWVYANLAATDGQFSGVSFSNADTSGVWFEGTGHMATAFEARNNPGDSAKAAAFLADIQAGQASAPNTDGHGVDAASKDDLDTGDGFDYFAALHIGATSWYCIADQSGNPFRL